MPVIPAQTLFDESKCYNCYGELTTGENIILALWRRVVLALNPSVDVSPQALVAYSKCYLCFTEGSMFDAMEMALMDIFSQQTCGTPTNTITFTAPSGGYDGTYVKSSDTLWLQSAPSDYGFRLVDGFWEVFEIIFPVTVWYRIDALQFPCGTWTRVAGTGPATAAYS